MSERHPPPGLGGQPAADPAPPAGRQSPRPGRAVVAPRPTTDGERGRGLPAGKVLLGGLLGLAVAILLNSEALLSDARQKPFGRSRDVSTAIWEPVEGVASALGLTAPRRWADEALGRDADDEASRVDTADGDQGAPSRSVLDDDGVQRIDLSGGAATVGDTESDVTAPETGTGTDTGSGTTAPQTFPTPEDPLELWIVGDSMVQFFGDTLAAMANDTGVVDAVAESKLSSGLSRPDFYDWPARLAELLADEDPDALVIMYGGNDAQGLQTADGVVYPFSEGWRAEYGNRVGAVMDLVTEGSGRRVLWVGQPIMRSGDFDAKMQELNAIYEQEASKRPGVTYVDTRPLFQNADGGFDRYLPDENGDLVDVRLSDGIHLSTAGGRWLSELLLTTLGEVVDLESGRALG